MHTHTAIVRATQDDVALLADIGRQSFMESHGHSAAKEDINAYADEKYSHAAVRADLGDAGNIYHLLYRGDQPAGYAKIVLNAPHPNIAPENTAKLERLYLLRAFYGLQLGARLLSFNIALSKQHAQAGMWLFVWTENHQAIGFYEKAGFKTIGSHDFKLTGTHSNPNYQMLLEYGDYNSVSYNTAALSG